MTEPRVLTVEEAARVLRIGRTAAYEAARRGDLPVVRIGRTIRVPRHGLAALLGDKRLLSSTTTRARRDNRARSKDRPDGADMAKDSPALRLIEQPVAPDRPTLAGPSPRFSRPWRDVDRLVAERKRALDALVAPRAQLTLEEAA